MKNIAVDIHDFKIKNNLYHRYDISYYSGLSTKEFTVLINLTQSKISGDCIRFGEYGKLSIVECTDILKVLKEHNKLIGNYEYIIGENHGKN